MIFLYHFEVLALDGVISSIDPAYLVPEDLLQHTRTVYRLTNNVSAVNAFLGDIPFLPPAVDPNGTGAQQFVPEAVEHEQIRLDGERNAGQLRVSLPMAHPLAQLYATDTPAVQVWLTLYQWDNAVPGALPLVIWVGQATSAEFDEHRCTLSLDHLRKVLARPGLTAKHPRSCGHLVYDKATCGVKAEALAEDGYWKFREDGLVATISPDGTTLNIPEAANKPDGWFAEGYLVLGGVYTQQSGNDDHVPRAVGNPLAGMQVYGGLRRSVVSHVGTVIKLAAPLPPGDYTGMNARVTLYAGCNGALQTCKQKFNNVARFGGYPYIPIKNPFEVGLKNANGS